MLPLLFRFDLSNFFHVPFVHATHFHLSIFALLLHLKALVLPLFLGSLIVQVLLSYIVTLLVTIAILSLLPLLVARFLRQLPPYETATQHLLYLFGLLESIHFYHLTHLVVATFHL